MGVFLVRLQSPTAGLYYGHFYNALQAENRLVPLTGDDFDVILAKLTSQEPGLSLAPDG
jgi:hypothetical protein